MRSIVLLAGKNSFFSIRYFLYLERLVLSCCVVLHFMKEDLVMRRLLTPKLIVGFVLVGLLASTFVVSFFSSSSYSQAASNRTIVGSWLLDVTLTSTHPPFSFQSLETYDAGGGLVTTDQISFDPQGLASPGHGTWVSRGGGKFATTWLSFVFDAKGNPTGWAKVQETITVSADGNTFSGSGVFTRYDAHGKPVNSGTSKFSGHRIRVA